jgi:chromosomal replication initiation ATPase DnaA
MKQPTVEQIEKYSCETYDVKIEDIKSTTTEAKHLAARKLTIYLIFHFTKMQSREIAQLYGRKQQSVDDFIREIRYLKPRDNDLKIIIKGFEYLIY